jgi:DNA-binding IclR family transcriptional regulator
MLDLRPRVFGSPLRSRVLVLIAALGETYPAEIARLLKAPRFSVQRIVDDLENERLIATRLWGNERRVTLQPASVGAKELQAYLRKLADGYPEFREITDSLRRRPRRRGKPLRKQA